MSQNSLSFVISSGPRLQNDPPVRRLIRKHAMKNVALTRKRRSVNKRKGTKQPGSKIVANTGPIGIPNDSLVPHSSSDESHEEDLSLQPGCRLATCTYPQTRGNETQSDRAGRSTYTKNTTQSSPICLHPEFDLHTAYEGARSRFKVDLTDLTMLTNFNVGRGTMIALAADPSRLLSLIGGSGWSYLEFVPSRYGLDPCVTSATDCLLAKVQGICIPSEGNEARELKLLSIALRALQYALNDQTLCTSSEVLCASQLLGLHALLGSCEDAIWSHHLDGSIRLIKHRTPARFTSEFDQALFSAHMGTVLFDSLMGNTPCYLEEPHWIDIYQSSAQNSVALTERSPLAISIRSIMIKLPRLWHKIDGAVLGPDIFKADIRAFLRTQCEYIHDDLLLWVEAYKTHCMRMSLVSPSTKELSMRRELYGTSLECLIVTKRLIATIYYEKIDSIETEVQELAQSLNDLQAMPSPNHSWLFSGRETNVTQSVLLTRDQWNSKFSGTSVSKELTARERYLTWSKMLRPD